ncbi:DUF2797 domain-containing protein [Bacteriovorax stolpii]|uniref:DUF2797 domain-containing protein n=1 Tax=Bacteriovorax stolpii TaxID=960 RepID=A0A2K9NR01_BACTC|nr:DUF2797 domain-containing protein [Bacteriovorax stolpii]AUN97922.1 DUF2797 domain-containing protein [Bacteriovorax stolpii]QDK42092.1 DUF2797 domain-containing protein [Bacteriovorax stolpii]TDP51753.1 uncharacterized protein DUF2797 [Bacteriovorax stolpii]
MSTLNGFNLDKMEVELLDGKAIYKLLTPEGPVLFNDLIGKDLKLIYHKEINCTNCGKKTAKSYSGGYCYPCSIKLAECDMCILRPETCHFERGTCREPDWGLQNCMIPHYVYLANSSGLKVGITRTSQIPIRWIDQGATQALPILKVGTRYQSGVFEKLLSSEINDKTDWRKMLKGVPEEIDLQAKRDELFELFGDDLDDLEGKFGSDHVSILENEDVIDIEYPVLTYPEKVSSMSFDKQEVVGGKLLGIKGQYLIFDVGVINIRSHTGYKVHLEH